MKLITIFLSQLDSVKSNIIIDLLFIRYLELIHLNIDQFG